MTVCYSVENHPNDSRVKIDENGTVQALTQRMGTGGNNQPLVVYGISAYESNAMKSPNPHSGIYEADTARTIDANGGNPACNQGGMVIVSPEKTGALCASGYGKNGTQEAMNEMYVVEKHTAVHEVIPINTMVATRGGADDGRTTFGIGEPGEPQFTLQAAHSHAVAICADIGFFNSYENQATSLLARQYKDPPLVCYWDGGQTAGTLTASNANGAQRMPDKDNFNCVLEDKMEQRYIVRRLTPLECCRLQGFPDGWGEPDAKEDFTGEEFEFWLDVRNTHGQINGKAVRHYTKAQMLTWYNKLHTDSAEYKMWGNGVALPCVRYVMQGIVDAVKEEENNA